MAAEAALVEVVVVVMAATGLAVEMELREEILHLTEQMLII
jgi:hypothetical protein